MESVDTDPYAPVPVVMSRMRLSLSAANPSRIPCRRLRGVSPSMRTKPILSRSRCIWTRFNERVQQEKTMLLESVPCSVCQLYDEVFYVPLRFRQPLLDIVHESLHFGGISCHIEMWHLEPLRQLRASFSESRTPDFAYRLAIWTFWN
jgi:hypothetical protein